MTSLPRALSALFILLISTATHAQALQPGDQIGLIAPAFAVKQSEVQKSIKHLQSLGLVPILAPQLTAHSGFFAGDVQKRVRDIHQFYSDPNIKAIIAVRGGYGTAQLARHLDYQLIQTHPKPLIGFSDLTALIHQIHSHVPLAQLYHGPVGKTLNHPKAISWFQETLMSHKKRILIRRPTAFDLLAQKDISYTQFASPNHPTEIQGQIVGGNLTLLASMAGTDYINSFRDRIVFIEAIGEQPYRIHRMLLQLIQGTDLLQAKGIIFGIFADCTNKSAPHSMSIQQVIQQLFDPTSLPYFYGMPIGHIDINATIPYGHSSRFSFTHKELSIDL